MKLKKHIQIVGLLLISAISCNKDLSYKDNLSKVRAFKKNERTDKLFTLKNKFFEGNFETIIPIAIAKSHDNKLTRYILPLKTDSKKTIFKYLLVESKVDGTIANFCYLISKRILNKDLNLFSLSVQKDSILLYEHTLYPNTRILKNRIKEKLVAKTLGKKFNSDVTLQSVLPPDENISGQPICIDWYWTTYNADTGEIISEDYLYTSCYTNTGGGGDSGSGDYSPPTARDIYICAGSFNFQSQGSGSITNISKTWGINAAFITSQATYSTTFGLTTYAPTDVLNWGNAWSFINLNFHYLVQNGDIWLRTDNQGGLHLMYNSRAQSEIAAAATDYASDNNRNPKSILTQPNGSSLYKQRFKELYTEYMKNYIPGTTSQIQNTRISGSTQASYSNTPC